MQIMLVGWHFQIIIKTTWSDTDANWNKTIHGRLSRSATQSKPVVRCMSHLVQNTVSWNVQPRGL